MKLLMPTLLRGDARALPLADASVDLIVTSPPYFGLRDYGVDGQLGDEPSPWEFLDALIGCTREMARVLKPSGSIFVNLGDKYSGAQYQTQTGVAGRRHKVDSAAVWAQTNPKRTGIPDKSLMLLPERYRIRAVDELRLVARAVLVWSKPNGLPESVTDRVRRSHEDWVHLTREKRYFHDLDGLREPHRPDTLRTSKHGGRPMRARNANLPKTGVGAYAGPHPDGRLPGSVWEIATQPLQVPAHVEAEHFAAYPTEWPRRLVTGWCPPDGVVLDPFGGTGTTALVATMLGRRGISVDLNPDYARLAAWRCADPKERARAAGLAAERVARVAPGRADQGSLFDEVGGARVG